MQTPRFFIDPPLPREAGARVTLDARAVRHANVLRLQAGDALALFDGRGGECRARLTRLGKREGEACVVCFEPIERESALHLTLVQALATGEKMDAIVQKATELGVAAIQPIATLRATLKLSGERAGVRHAHWHGVAVSACEQCGRNRVPEVRAPLSFEAWLETPPSGVRMVLHPGGGRTLDGVPGAAAIEIAVGPEGGFADREIAAAEAAGALLVSAGPRVLRTETAGPALLAALNALVGDWRETKRIP